MSLLSFFLLPLIRLAVEVLLFWIILQYGFKKNLKKISILTLIGILVIGQILGHFFTVPGYSWIGDLVYLIMIGVALYKKFNLTKKQLFILIIVDILVILSFSAYNLFSLKASLNNFKSNPNKIDLYNKANLEKMSDSEILANMKERGVNLDYFINNGATEKEVIDIWRHPDQDADGDGLINIEEILMYQTNPLKADTDGDGVSDFSDNALTNKKTNEPQKTSEESTDDTIYIKALNDAKSKGVNLDFDGLGLVSNKEIDVWLHPDRDDDGDGLKNIDEIMTYKTNPLKADTDGDGYADKEEIDSGHDPLSK